MTSTIELVVDGMHCASCGLLVDETVEELDGVQHCQTDVRRGLVSVVYDSDRVAPPAFTAAIEGLGYSARPAARE